MRTHLYTDKLKPLFMNKLMTLFLGAASIAALASCSSTKNTATISDLSGEWSIAAIDGKTVESPENQKNADSTQPQEKFTATLHATQSQVDLIQKPNPARLTSPASVQQ